MNTKILRMLKLKKNLDDLIDGLPICSERAYAEWIREELTENIHENAKTNSNDLGSIFDDVASESDKQV